MTLARIPAGVALLVLLVLWLFRGALFGGGVLYERDLHLIWHPQVEGFVRAVAAGSLPLWDPSPSFGQRLLADPSAQLLYPPTWLNLVLRPWTYYTAFAAGHFLLAALGTWALGRRFGLSPPAAALSAAVFVLSGPFWSLTDLWHHLASAAWMPVVILTADRACASGRARDAVAAGLCFGAQALAGSADMCTLTAATGIVVLGARHRPERLAPSQWLGLARTGAILGTVALLLSAGVWLPAGEALLGAVRSEFPAAMREYWSVHPASLLELVVPEPFQGLALRAEARAALYEGREPFIRSLYLGLPALALAVAALTRRREAGLSPSGTDWRVALAATTVLAVVLALGRHTPLFALLGWVFPPLQILRYPVKVTVAAAFGVSLLAGAGLDAWRLEAPRQRRRLVLAALAFGLLAAGLVAADAWLRARPGEIAARLVATPQGADPSQALAWLRARTDVAALLGIVSALALASRLARPGRFAGPLLACAAVADLAAWHRNPSPLAPVALYTHRPRLVDAIASTGNARVFVHDYSVGEKSRLLLGRDAAHVLARAPEGWPGGAAMALSMQQTLAGQTPGRWGLRQAYDIDYRGLHSRGTALLGALLRQLERSDSAGYVRLLQLGGVTHVVALHDEQGGLRLLDRFESLLAEPTRLYGVPDPLPRCLLVSGARIAAEREALRQLADPAFDPRREVIVPAGEALAADPTFRAKVVGCEAGPDWMRVSTDADRDAWLVLTESFAPGWRAEIDGRPSPLLAANVAFRAVRVPAGRHDVRLRYRPLPAYVGLGLTALTALAGLWLFVSGAVDRRSRP